MDGITDSMDMNLSKLGNSGGHRSLDPAAHEVAELDITS